MYVRLFKLSRFARAFEELAVDGGQGGGAAAPAAAPAGAPAAAPAPAAVAPAAGPAPAVGAPAAPAPQLGSLMARGSAAPAAGPAPAGSPAPAEPAPPAVADKFIVKNEDGSTNWEASALKQAQAYDGLEKRMGSGEAPPKTVDEYAPDLPEGITMDQLKGDPLYAGFLKGAHSKGLNNAQVGYILSEFQHRMAMMRSPEAGEAALVQALNMQPPQLHDHVYVPAFRAAKAFAEDDAMHQRLDTKFGSDPDYLRLMARIGREMGEDKTTTGLSSNEANTLEDLVAHPAYTDDKHADHKKVTGQVEALYQKKYAGQ